MTCGDLCVVTITHYAKLWFVTIPLRSFSMPSSVGQIKTNFQVAERYGQDLFLPLVFDQSILMGNVNRNLRVLKVLKVRVRSTTINPYRR